MSSNDKVQKILHWILDAGINGLGIIITPAKELAEEYLEKEDNTEDAINSLIAWRSTYAAGSGFITGMGGFASLPLGISAGLAYSYVLAANTVAAIAYLRGYDINSEAVKTMILLCLIGEVGVDILEQAGIKIGTKVFQNLINQIPGRVLIEINKKVGFRLITKAGEKGVINLMKIVPLVGGVVSGAVDSQFVNSCAKTAKRMLKQA